MMSKELQRLILAANNASDQAHFGPYPMAPSIGLTEKEIRKHAVACEKHDLAAKALVDAGFLKEAIVHKKACENHNWVVNKVGNH
jgi:hypothetical protein